jgi:hypothetical protein
MAYVSSDAYKYSNKFAPGDFFPRQGVQGFEERERVIMDPLLFLREEYWGGHEPQCLFSYFVTRNAATRTTSSRPFSFSVGDSRGTPCHQAFISSW